MIRTFIFFDLETTGLITNNTMPKVTEMSLIAVSRNNICDTMDPLPRVLHKLILPIHPAEVISTKIQKLTDLSNENLKAVQPFNCEIYTLVTNFIKRLTAPTCFVAFNGDRFDYPIFLWELNSINKVLGEDILSIDMLHLTKAFFLTKNNPIEETNNAQVTNCTSSNTEDISILLNDGYDEMLSNALDSVMNSSFNSCNKKETAVLKNRETAVLKTPQPHCYKKMQEINEKTPEGQKIGKSQYSNINFRNKKESTTRKKLYFTPNSRPANFKLSSIYEHFFRTNPENAHSAEGDCLTMIRCAIHIGNFFVEWADRNAVPLTNHTKQQ